MTSSQLTSEFSSSVSGKLDAKKDLMQNVKLSTDFWHLLNKRAGGRCFSQQEDYTCVQTTSVWIHRLPDEPLAKQQHNKKNENE